jgi:exopolysaccharide production protein ExoZ
MAVVLHHTDLYVGQQVGPLPRTLSTIMSFGYVGVDFFFVLSGFIIYYTNYSRRSLPSWPRDYLESRLTRIYLPYLPIGCAVALVYGLFPQVRHADSPWGWFSTLTLLPSNAEPALHVAWTLQHEIIFYAVAFLLLWSRKILIGSVLWAVAILALLPRGFMLQPGVSPIDLEFLFGIAVAWAFINHSVRFHWALIVFGIASVVGFFAIGDRQYSVLLGLGFAAILLPVARLEAAGHLRVPAFWVLIGDASYAIYLIHVPLLSVVVRLFHGLHPLVAAAAGIVASACGGVAYHLLLEKPVLRLVRARLRPRRREETGAG